MPIGDRGAFVSFDFKIKFSNSHMKHHFLFAPGIHMRYLTSGNRTHSSQEIWHVITTNEIVIAYIHDLE